MLTQLNQFEFGKLIKWLRTKSNVKSLELLKVYNYEKSANEYVIKTNKLTHDDYIKVKITYD